MHPRSSTISCMRGRTAAARRPKSRFRLKARALMSSTGALSMARVETGGPFSAFPGVDRTLSILEGEGHAADDRRREPVFGLTNASAAAELPRRCGDSRKPGRRIDQRPQCDVAGVADRRHRVTRQCLDEPAEIALDCRSIAPVLPARKARCANRWRRRSRSARHDTLHVRQVRPSAPPPDRRSHRDFSGRDRHFFIGCARPKPSHGAARHLVDELPICPFDHEKAKIRSLCTMTDGRRAIWRCATPSFESRLSSCMPDKEIGWCCACNLSN